MNKKDAISYLWEETAEMLCYRLDEGGGLCAASHCRSFEALISLATLGSHKIYPGRIDMLNKLVSLIRMDLACYDETDTQAIEQVKSKVAALVKLAKVIR